MIIFIPTYYVILALVHPVLDRYLRNNIHDKHRVSVGIMKLVRSLRRTFFEVLDLPYSQRPPLAVNAPTIRYYLSSPATR